MNNLRDMVCAYCKGLLGTEMPKACPHCKREFACVFVSMETNVIDLIKLAAKNGFAEIIAEKHDEYVVISWFTTGMEPRAIAFNSDGTILSDESYQAFLEYWKTR